MPADTPSLEIDDSESYTQGEPVVIIGHPLCHWWSVATGVFSVERVEDRIRQIQVSATINHGNSGGPILNKRGQIIGIVLTHYSEGVGEGLPGHTLRVILHSVQLGD